MKKILSVILFLVPTLIFCQSEKISAKLTTSPKETFSKVVQTLALDGFSISYSDADAGVITTQPKEQKVTKDQCDCGKFLGLNYLRDKRTFTNVTYQAIIKDSTLTVVCNITGVYKPNNYGVSLVAPSYAHDKQLICTSKGVLEREFIDKVLVK